MPINPSDKQCFRLCMSCFKCSEKGKFSKCNTCSGRHDPGASLKFDPYDIDSYCDCRNGVLRHRLQTGKLILKRFLSNPFQGIVKTDAPSEDERDWNRFVKEKQEQLGDPNYSPITFQDGSSVDKWMQSWQEGK